MNDQERTSKMGYSNTKVYDIVYDTLMYAGFDVEIAEAAATGSVNFAGKVIDRLMQDACQDRYIATVIERARVATLHKELSAARHAY